MSTEKFLRRLPATLTPSKASRKHVLDQISMRIGTDFPVTNKAFPESVKAKAAVWQRVSKRIGVFHADSLLTQIRGLLTPPSRTRLKMRQAMLRQVNALPQPIYARDRFKWIASGLVAAVVIGSSPALFLTSTTVAESSVLLVPTAGIVEIERNGMWEPIDAEVELTAGMRIRTIGGEASIIYRDDAVIRLDADATVKINDTSELIEPASRPLPVLTLEDGRVWVQGLIPSSLRGLTVAVIDGSVTVNEGSMSVTATDDAAEVSVWDRHVNVLQNGSPVFLVAGEHSQLQAGAPAEVSKINGDDLTSAWAEQNQARDEVHREYVAKLQQERRVAQAGILPTSSLYPVKRAAETVDVLLTFDDESRVQKKLDLANARLNEAAALLADGNPEEIASALETYRGTLRDAVIDSGSSSTVAQFMIRQSLSETISGVTALMPEDENYVLKKTVIEATAGMPDETFINAQELQAMLFADALDSVDAAVEAGDADRLNSTWSDLQQYISLVESEESTLTPELREEATALLERFALAVEEKSDKVAAVDPAVLGEILTLVPEKPAPPVPEVKPLTDDEVKAAVQAILDRVYAFEMPQSRQNQLRSELTTIAGHPEEGRFLRALFDLLPPQSRLSDMVRRAITDLRWEKAAETSAL